MAKPCRGPSRAHWRSSMISTAVLRAALRTLAMSVAEAGFTGLLSGDAGGDQPDREKDREAPPSRPALIQERRGRVPRMRAASAGPQEGGADMRHQHALRRRFPTRRPLARTPAPGAATRPPARPARAGRHQPPGRMPDRRRPPPDPPQPVGIAAPAHQSWQFPTNTISLWPGIYFPPQACPDCGAGACLAS